MVRSTLVAILCLHPYSEANCIPFVIILVIVNFSTDSYRAVVNDTSVAVRVMAFGSFDTPFLVQVIPDAVDIPAEGNCRQLNNCEYYSVLIY